MRVRTPTGGHADTPSALDGAAQPRRLGRPRWWDWRIIAGVVLIVVAIVVGARVIGASSRTTPVYAAARDLAPGTQLVAGDLVPVDVRLGDSLRLYLSADGTGQHTLGRRVVDRVGAGQLVPTSALDAPADGRVIVIGVPAEAMPPGVGHGSVIDLYLTTGSTGAAAAMAARTEQVASAITVQSVTAPASGGLSGASSNRYQIGVLLDPVTADRLVRLLPGGQPVVVLRSGG